MFVKITNKYHTFMQAIYLLCINFFSIILITKTTKNRIWLVYFVIHFLVMLSYKIYF